MPVKQTTSFAGVTATGKHFTPPKRKRKPKQQGPSVSWQARMAIIVAQSQIGVPYVYAAINPIGRTYKGVKVPPLGQGSGFDCSGLTKFCYQMAGVVLPHNAEAQYELLSSMGHQISPDTSQLLPGDLLFFSGADPRGTYGIGHVEIYVDDGYMIGADHTGTPVRYDQFGGAQYAARPRFAQAAGVPAPQTPYSHSRSPAPGVTPPNTQPSNTTKGFSRSACRAQCLTYLKQQKAQFGGLGPSYTAKDLADCIAACEIGLTPGYHGSAGAFSGLPIPKLDWKSFVLRIAAGAGGLAFILAGVALMAKQASLQDAIKQADALERADALAKLAAA